MSWMNQAIENLQLYMRNIIGRGRITLVDDSKVIQQMQVTMNAGEIIDELSHIGEYGFVSNPPIGSDILAVFVTGDRSNGAIIGSNSQQFRMKNLLPGESAIHDNLGKYVYLTAAGIVINAGGQPVTVNGATTVTINASSEVVMNTPNLLVNGNITATGDIIDNTGSNSDSVANMRNIYNSHIHSDPQGGDVSTPTPTM